MSNTYFKFQQFVVHQQHCAMKVGTDGVLLGAWADMNDSYRLLDVGSGTGLLALMVAQRNENAQIVGVELDAKAAQQAKENVVLSPFANRIQIVNTSFQYYAQENNVPFDLLISNPPFFSRSLLAPHQNRTAARHDESLTLHDLFYYGGQLLREEGKIAFIYPFDRLNDIQNTAMQLGWQICRQTDVYPTSHALAPKRVLIEAVKEAFFKDCNHSTLIIENERHHYSPAFKKMVQKFYLPDRLK